MADKTEGKKSAEVTPPPAPAAKSEPAATENAAAETVKALTIGGLIAGALGSLAVALNSKDGRKVLGKAGATAMQVGELGLKELTHERGALATTLREKRRDIIEIGAKQRRLKKREDHLRFIQTLLMPLRLFIPVPLWATTKADDDEDVDNPNRQPARRR